jgi:cytochrome P450
LEKYGDFVLVTPKRYLTHDPAIVEQIVSDYLTFGHELVQDYTEAGVMFWGNAMGSRSDPTWLRQRRLMQPAFQPSRIIAYGDAMVAHTTRMLDAWQEHAQFDLHNALKRLTLRLIIENVVGVELSDQEVAQIIEALEATLALFADLSQMELEFDTPEKIRFRETLTVLDQVVYRTIERRRADPDDHGDMLFTWMRSEDETGQRLTDTELRDEIVTHLRAGYRNTATALAWVFALLASHPQTQDQLAAELDRVLGGQRPHIAALPRLEYVERILKESMRLYPLYPTIGRLVKQDCELNGEPLAAGSAISISVWAMHRDARYFSDPDRFDPDRWTDALERALPKLAFFPFGGGPRQCPFKSYGMLEMTLVLATISQRFRIELAPEERAKPQYGMNGLVPMGGLKVIAQRRTAAR